LWCRLAVLIGAIFGDWRQGYQPVLEVQQNQTRAGVKVCSISYATGEDVSISLNVVDRTTTRRNVILMSHNATDPCSHRAGPLLET
jgi:hypothetical protein